MSENKKTAKKKDAKPSSFAKISKNITKFFKDIRSELKKVVWLNRKQLTNNTITVLITCALVGVIIWLSDFGMATLFSAIFG